MAGILTYRGMAVVALLAITAPASAQGFGEHNVKPSAYPVENRPKVDEKAYKAALERIPASKEKYDPWGAARPSDSAKPKTR
jgi:hypothetical protein